MYGVTRSRSAPPFLSLPRWLVNAVVHDHCAVVTYSNSPMASISAGLRRAATCYPDRIAMIFQERQTTWRAFSAAVERLAQALLALGLRRGQILAVVARNSDLMMQYMYAAAHLGAIFAPLNVRWSPQELEHAVRDSGASVIAFDSEFRPTIAALLLALDHGKQDIRAVIQLCPEDAAYANGCCVGEHRGASVVAGVVVHQHAVLVEEGGRGALYISSDGGAVADEEDGCGRGDDVCTLVFTSGSEGRPKAVMLSHTNQVVQALEKVVQVRYSASTRYLNAVPLFHVGGISSAVAVTMAGGMHILASKFEPVAARLLIQKHAISTLVVVPSMLAILCDRVGAVFPQVGPAFWRDPT